MTATLYLESGRRYRVRGKGPIASPPLTWHRDTMTFGSRADCYSVNDVQWVQVARVGRTAYPWVPIDECRMAKALDAYSHAASYGQRRKTVLAAVEAQPGSLCGEIAERIGATRSVTANALKTLRDDGLLVVVPDTKRGHAVLLWYVASAAQVAS